MKDEAWSFMGPVGIVIQSVLAAVSACIRVGFSVGGVRTDTIRPWLSTVGLVGAALLFVGTAIGIFDVNAGPGGTSLIGLVGWLMWLFWVASFGVVLVRQKKMVSA